VKTIGLADLLVPITHSEFFNSYWPSKPLYVPPSPTKLESLFVLPQLQDVRFLVSDRLSKVRACLPDYDDEYSSILVDPEDALKVFRNNMTLVFDSMQTQSETIAGVLANVRADLGLIVGDDGESLTHSRAIVYATPAGGRTRLHFDANANFVIQLKGTKRWRLAPNTSVAYPTERYTSCTGEIAAALEQQCHAPLLDELPDESLEFVLEPRSVLFVPRGYWHETTTEDDSLSLNFTFSQPTWADVFAKSLHGHLLQSESWRELADAIEGSDTNRRQRSLARLEQLFRELVLELPGLSASQLLTEAGLLK
jgi:50S ribosomal protein L16 3-hydroxylase